MIASLKEDITNLEEKFNLLQKENEQFRSEVTTKSKEIEFLRENNDYNVRKSSFFY